MNETTDPTYIRIQILDEIPELVYTKECESNVDKNGNPLSDEEWIRYLTNGEHKYCDDVIEKYDENGDLFDYMNYEDYYFCMNHNKYDLRKMTKQIRIKKFICPIEIT